MSAHLQRSERINPKVNAIVTLADDALDRARAAEMALMNDEPVGPLHGLPLTIKDTIDTAGLRTTSGSRPLADHVPDRDATVVARLKDAGAIIIGKTNTPEMAIPYETNNPVFGRTNNPHDLERTAGGSSGGEAAAIAACLSPAGIGSDLSGSIRVPAHFCGIAGLKPTTGFVSVDGHTPRAEGSLLLGVGIGPMARTVGDLALLLKVIAGDAKLQPAREIRGLRAAWYVNDGIAPVDEEIVGAVERAASALHDAGVKVEQARPPGVEHGLRLWLELFSPSVLRQLSEFYREREGEAGPQAAAILGRAHEADSSMEGKIAAAERQAKAVVERERLREELLRWMKTTPIIIAPVGATCAFKHGARRVEVNSESVSVFRAFSYSQTYNVFGMPGVAVPAGRSARGLPIGVQVVGPPFEEQTVLAVAEIVEEALGGWQPIV